eukprot:8216260-Heterocapsa_arctica.AAC.1
MANQDVYTTTDMATVIKVEELMTTEEKGDCRAHRFVNNQCGHIHIGPSAVMRTVMDVMSRRMLWRTS